MAERIEAGIYKTAPGVYDLHVSTGRNVDGTYGKATKRFRGTLTAARNERAKMLAAVADGRLRPATPTTMAELHDRYMASKPTLAAASKDQYEYLWGLLDPHIGATRVAKLRTIDLDHAYAEIAGTVSANTTRKAHKHAVALLNRAVAWELTTKNVATKATPPAEVPYNLNPPTHAQVIALVDAASRQEPSFGALVYLAATTGARRGELCGLRWCDVDLDAGTLRIVHQADPDGTLRPTKTKHQRVIPLDADSVAMLERHSGYCDSKAAEVETTITADCFVFSPWPGNGLPYRVDGVTQRFDRLTRSTGIRCRFHDLRHAQATRLLAAGVSPVVAAQRLGQTVEVLLSTYGHSDRDQAARAAHVGGLGVGVATEEP